MALFKREPAQRQAQVDFSRLPRHIAIIMDGNGRWAKRRGLPRTAGHAAGAENFRTIATYCKEIGIEYLTVYAFSTENWKRPAEEVSAIMGLLKKYLLEAIGRMERDRVKMRFFGDLTALDQELQDLCRRTEEISRRYEGCQVDICLTTGQRRAAPGGKSPGPGLCGGGAGPGSAHRGGSGAPPLLRRGARPGPGDPAQRRDPRLQFPAVAGGLCRVLFHRRVVARFLQRGTSPGAGGLPEPLPPVWQGV